MSLNIEGIKKDVKLFEAGIEGKIKENVALVFGSNRSGKTTFMNIMAGKAIEKVKVKGSWGLDVVNKEYAKGISNEGFKEMAIVHGGDAATKFPNYIQVKDMQLWDFPGLCDNRTTEIEISNSCCIHKILRNVTALGKGGCRIIIVQDYGSTSVQGGKSFKDCLKTMCAIFEPWKNVHFVKLISSTVFVFTKVPSDILDDPSFTPEMFISDVIDKLITNVSLEDLENKPYDDQACAKFIKCMRWIHDRDSAKLQFIKIPSVTWNSKDMSVFTNPIMNPNNGVIAKLASIPPLVECDPKLAVSTEAAHIVLKIQKKYEVELNGQCQLFKTQLINEFQKADKEQAISTLMDLKSIFCIDNSQLAHGGATQLSKELIVYLEKIETGEPCKYCLENIKKTVANIEFFDLIIRNSRAGANFLLIYDAIWNACSEYATVQEIKEKENYIADCKAYMDEQNNISSILFALSHAIPIIEIGFVTLAAPFVLGEKIIRNITGTEKERQWVVPSFVDKVTTALKKVQDEWHGTTLKKPCEHAVETFTELKDSFNIKADSVCTSNQVQTY